MAVVRFSLSVKDLMDWHCESRFGFEIVQDCWRQWERGEQRGNTGGLLTCEYVR